MSVDINQAAITDAVFDVILQSYTTSPTPGLPPPVQSNGTFFSYVWPGSPLQESSYQNPWSPDNSSGSMLASEHLSNLVDPVPTLTRAYNLSGDSVEFLYQLILLATPTDDAQGRSTPTSEPGTDSGTFDLGVLKRVITDNTASKDQNAPQAIVDNSPDEIKANELSRQYSDAVASLVASRLSSVAPADLSAKSVGPSNADLEANVSSTWNTLQTESPPASVQSRGSSSPVSMTLDRANQIFQLTNLGSLITPGLKYHASYASPSNFADPAVVGAWPYLYSLPATLSDGTPVGISFRFSRVDIRRPWLIMNLLQMTGWGLTGQAAGSLSNGQSADNPGNFPLLPTSFVVARDVVIAGVGTNSSTILFEEPGLQILAWINTVVPFIPPS